MERKDLHSPKGGQMQGAEKKNEEVIPVIQERAVVRREIQETGKVRVRKKVTEETAIVNLPIINESYHIERIPVESKILDEPPPAVRYEGNKTIVTVLKEITVVQKKYEVIEEIHLTLKLTETPMVQEITLRKEHVDIERSGNNTTT